MKRPGSSGALKGEPIKIITPFDADIVECSGGWFYTVGRSARIALEEGDLAHKTQFIELVMKSCDGILTQLDQQRLSEMSEAGNG